MSDTTGEVSPLEQCLLADKFRRAPCPENNKNQEKKLFAACSRLDGVLFLLIRQISQAVGGRSSDCQVPQWG